MHYELALFVRPSHGAAPECLGKLLDADLIDEARSRLAARCRQDLRLLEPERHLRAVEPEETSDT